MNPASDPLKIPPIPQPEPSLEPQRVPEKQPRSIPAWRFWAPLAIQMVLLLSVPSQSAYTYVTGKTAVLQTAPVDPYDFLRGYSQTLSYDISSGADLSQLPGGKAVFEASPPLSHFYVVLQAPAHSPGPRPTPWQAVSVSPQRPDDLGENQLALRGELTQWGQVHYGLESYYMPEDRREEINQAIGQVQWQDPEAFVVEIKIDGRGQAIPISLWVREQNYQF